MLAINADAGEKPEDLSDFSSDEDDVGYSYAPLEDQGEDASHDYYSAIPSGDAGEDEQVPEPTEENIDVLLENLRDMDLAKMDIRTLSEGILGFLTMAQQEGLASDVAGALSAGDTESTEVNGSDSVPARAEQADVSHEVQCEEPEERAASDNLSLTKGEKLTIGEGAALSPDESSAIAAAMSGWAPPVAQVPDYLKNMDDKELLKSLFKDA